MIKVVVTGGAGFIGSHLAQGLLEKGFEVTIIDNLKTGRLNNIESFKDKLKFVEGDILDLELLKREFVGVDTVFHHAAVVSIPETTEDPLGSHEVNSTGTLKVLIAARDAGVRRVVYASSSAVYGARDGVSEEGDASLEPLSLYAAHKMTDEMYASLFSKLYGLETVGLRYFNVFGPRQNPHSKYSAVIPIFFEKISAGERVVINGDGTTTRDFVYVDNVVDANIRASQVQGLGSAVFNIACGQSTSLNELVQKIGLTLGKNPVVEYADFRLGDILHSLANIDKAKEILGYIPKVGLEDGLRRMVG